MEEVRNEKQTAVDENVTPLDLPGKLYACAKQQEERYREKHGEDARLPGSIRLMYSAGGMLLVQKEQIAKLEDQLQALTGMLSDQASCGTCKSGPAKKCSVRGECGESKGLWSLKDPASH